MLDAVEGERAADKVADIRFPEPAPCGKTPLMARNLTKTYGSLEVFTGVDLAIDRGSQVVILGLNGAGKTTLLRILAGAEQPDTGAGSTPRTGRTRPSSPSSPIRTVDLKRACGTFPSAASVAVAMARSKCVPAFGRPAGVRLIVNTLLGHDNPVAQTAARHRSRASWRAASGRPTSTVRGSPDEIAASTSTMEPSIPTNATDHALAPVTGYLAHV